MNNTTKTAAVLFFSLILGGCITVMKKSTYLDTMDRLDNLAVDKASLEENIAQLEGRISSLEEEIARLKRENTDLSENLNKKETELFEKMNRQTELIAQKEKELAELKKEKSDIEAQLSMQINELNLKTQTMEDQIGKLQMTKDSLESNLKEEIESKQIQITMIRNSLSVNMVDKILFDTGKAELKESGKKVLEKVGKVLKKVENRDIRIEGHTDNVPIGESLREKFPTNWELSTQRATNVVRYLEETSGIPGENLVAVGYSKYRPIGDNNTYKGREQNRRIEITIVPKNLNRVIDEVISTEPQDTP